MLNTGCSIVCIRPIYLSHNVQTHVDWNTNNFRCERIDETTKEWNVPRLIHGKCLQRKKCRHILPNKGPTTRCDILDQSAVTPGICLSSNSARLLWESGLNRNEHTRYVFTNLSSVYVVLAKIHIWIFILLLLYTSGWINLDLPLCSCD